MPTADIIALIVFLAPLAYSPGPGNMFFAALGARYGLRACTPALAGYHLATLIVSFAIGLGYATAVAGAPWIGQALRFAGSAYVLWLAVGLMRAGPLDSAVSARPAGFGSGALLLLLNPKGYVIMVLMMTQFAAAASPTRIAVIAVLFTLNNLVAFLVWALIGDRLARRFRSPGQARGLNMALGAALGLVALWMLLRA